MEVIRPGSSCKFVGSKESIQGIVIGVWIKPGGNISYQVAWWNGRTRVEDWVTTYEIEVDEGKTGKLPLGFVGSKSA